MIIHNPILTGSFSVNGADLSTITGSVATSASFDARTTYLESTSSILTAASASQSVTSGSLVAASASLSATSGSLSAASGSFNTRVSALEATGSALSSSLLTVSGSGYATSGSLNTRVSALEVTGSALSSSLLTVSGSGYATSASLSAASGSFNTRVATIESKYATTGSNTFIDTQVVSGSILQSGSFTSTGTLTAQTLVIQTITSSVVYSSGSNVFGNSLGNSQVFTGSVLITGSLTIAGASSATSYSGATIYGSTVACSPVGCFATSCATSFIGGTMSGTTIYGSTAVCSANGLLIGNGGVTATCNYLPKFTGTSTIGNSQVFDNATSVFINATTAPALGSPKFFVKMATANSYEGILVASSSNNNVIAIAHTGTLGLITTNYGTSGTNTNLGFGTGGATQMTLDTSGNLGLGVTPSAWESGYSVLQQNAKYFNAADGSANYQGINAYYNSGWKYIASGTAQYLQQFNGGFTFFNAPSGTAGCAITFTQAMTLTAAGRLLIGATDDSTNALQVKGDGVFANKTNSGVTSTSILSISTGGTYGTTAAPKYLDLVFSGDNKQIAKIRSVDETGNIDGGYLIFYTSTVAGTVNQNMILHRGGNLNIGTSGTTDAGYKLDVNGTGRFTGSVIIGAGSSATSQLDVTSNGSANGITIRNRSGDDYAFLNWKNYGGTELLAEMYVQRTAANTAVMRYTIANASETPATYLTIASTGAATFSSNVAIEAQLSFNSAALNIYTYGRVGLANAGRIIFNNGTGANMFLGELASNVYGFTANAYNSTAVLSMNMSSNAVSVAGALSKGSGTFRIDHPLESKKDTHHLIHSFVEGPRADLIYRGKVTLVNGTATINIDETVGMTEGTFIALNRDIQCFTTNESGWDLVKGKVEGNILTITSQNTESTNEISWMVVGERQDEHIKNTDWTDENGKPILEPLKIT